MSAFAREVAVQRKVRGRGCDRRRGGSSRRGFALVLVAMVALIAGFVVVLLLERADTLKRAQKREIDAYTAHHTQAGLKEFVDWWAGAFRRRDAGVDESSGTVGFDMQLSGNQRLKVRFYDAQGSMRLRTVGEERSHPYILNRAAADLVARGFTGAEYIRERGPGRVSIHSAPREVLSALARGVSPDAAGEAFASAVIAKRREGRIKLGDLRALTSESRMQEVDLHRLEACLSLDCEFWRIEAEATDALGDVVVRQGGWAVGKIRSENSALVQPWAIVWWGPLEEMPARVERE